MLSQSATVTTTVTTEVKISPIIRKKLLFELKAYAALKQQLGVIEHAMERHKEAASELREKTGESVLALDGFTVRKVQPVRSVLNKLKLVELGCAAAWIEEATETKPSKAYEKITVPGGKDIED